MREASDEDAMLQATDRMIARAEQRVDSEQDNVERAQRDGWDTSLSRRVVTALREWLSLLLERRSILLRWRRRDGDHR